MSEAPLKFKWDENKNGEVVIAWYCNFCACEKEFIIPPPYPNGIFTDLLEFENKTCETCNTPACEYFEDEDEDENEDEDECDWWKQA